MSRLNDTLARTWIRLGPQFLPFADAATPELPLGRLLRLALFQVSVGMAAALLNGTLNRVMIVELGVPAWVVALMVSLPLLFAPFRALIGYRSDTYRSVLGWRRVPFIWMGTLLQFGGLAIMPFALLVLTGKGHGPAEIGQVGAALAFLLVGAGMHTSQTAGLALATDLATEESRPRVVALLYVMLLLGMVVSSLLFGALLADFTNVHLIQVIQGAAMVTMGLNLLALWKQEPRHAKHVEPGKHEARFRDAWRTFKRSSKPVRLLVAVGLGTAGFSMQDILLEPYGGQILHLGVGATSLLTALLAAGSLVGFTIAAHKLSEGSDPHRLAAMGALVGTFAFAAVIFAAPIESAFMFRIGTVMIGFGGGLFAVGTLTAAMALRHDGRNGLALGAWGAVQASAAGLSIAFGGAIRDVVSGLASKGMLGAALSGPSVGYSVVYHIEIALLFATLVAIGPLVRSRHATQAQSPSRFGLAEFPG
ncbi:MAG: BCD family MFS transporter [Betaproteobacteria bacterium]